jgi:murein L,D-transpeptidase YafK
MKKRTLLLLTALLVAVNLAFRANSLQTLHHWLDYLMQFITRDTLPLPYPAPPAPEQWQGMTPEERLADVRSRLLPKLHDELSAKQLKLGQPAFIRIFKESREFELWIKGADNQWKLFRNYPIAIFSGSLGPKTREGDMQAPEGFYTVTQKQLHPASSYHLSFNIGYPNAYDLAHQRTGSLIMVHGRMVSIGCFAMTDPLIEEIYLFVEAALKNGATVPVHIFPFHMTEARLKTAEPKHLDFWRSLQPAHDVFESSRRVPIITVENGSYITQAGTAN